MGTISSQTTSNFIFIGILSIIFHSTPTSPLCLKREKKCTSLHLHILKSEVCIYIYLDLCNINLAFKIYYIKYLSSIYYKHNFFIINNYILFYIIFNLNDSLITYTYFQEKINSCQVQAKN